MNYKVEPYYNKELNPHGCIQANIRYSEFDSGLFLTI